MGCGSIFQSESQIRAHFHLTKSYLTQKITLGYDINQTKILKNFIQSNSDRKYIKKIKNSEKILVKRINEIKNERSILKMSQFLTVPSKEFLLVSDINFNSNINEISWPEISDEFQYEENQISNLRKKLQALEEILESKKKIYVRNQDKIEKIIKNKNYSRINIEISPSSNISEQYDLEHLNISSSPDRIERQKTFIYTQPQNIDPKDKIFRSITSIRSGPNPNSLGHQKLKNLDFNLPKRIYRKLESLETEWKSYSYLEDQDLVDLKDRIQGIELEMNELKQEKGFFMELSEIGKKFQAIEDIELSLLEEIATRSVNFIMSSNK